MSDDDDIIRVPKARLRAVKAEIDQLKHELAVLREEHESLQVHLKGSIQEVARLKDENGRLRA